MAKLHQYLVSIYYTTPTGRPAHTSMKLKAENEEKAEQVARKKFRNRRKGKGYKINGGDTYRLG